MDVFFDPKFVCKKDIAFVIAVYNREKTIGECLDSILMQDLNAEYDILVVDDGSTDNTLNILKDYSKRYPDKLKVISLEKNHGLLYAQKIFFNHVRSKYFHFIGSDDYLYSKNIIQESFNFLEKHPDFNIHGGQAFCFKDKDKKHKSGFILSKWVLGCSYTFDDYHKISLDILPSCSCLLRNVLFHSGIPTSLFQSNFDFDEFIFRGETYFLYETLRRGKLYLAKKFYHIYATCENNICQNESYITKKIRCTYCCLFRAQSASEHTYKTFFEALFFYHFSKILRLIYKNLNNVQFLNQENRKLLNEIFCKLPNSNLDWSKCKWHSNILVKSFYKLRTYAYLLYRQGRRILLREEF